MRRSSPSTISISYVNPHRIMSPSTLNTANLYDNQCTSLFGDPVPPPADNFFEDLDKNLYGSLRGRSSSTQSNSIVEDFPKANSFVAHGDRTSIPASSRRTPSSRLGRKDSDDPPASRIFSANQDRLASISPTENGRYSVEINLPESRYGPQNGILNHPRLVVSPPSQEYDANDLWNVNISSRSRRIPPELFEDSRIGMDATRNLPGKGAIPSRIFANDPTYFRRGSNESFSSGEWFKPSNEYQEWAKIPRLRPSSKNIMLMHQEPGRPHGSPLASLIKGSNTSTSSEEKASPETIKMQGFNGDRLHMKISQDADDDSAGEDSPPKELPPPTSATIPKEIPLPIVTNAVTTGSNFRANPPRPQKKPSFSIVAERSPQSSRPTSPSPVNSGRVSPFLGYGFKEPPKPTARRKSLQSSKIQLPKITDSNNNFNTSDDSVRPLVQFDMSFFSAPKDGRPKVPERTKKKRLQSAQPAKQITLPKVKSYESLPKIMKSASPQLPPRRMNKSSLELGALSKKNLPIPTKNPTSQQQGILGVYSVESSPKSLTPQPNGAASMGNVSTNRRTSLSPIRKDQRTDSISSERRSSSLTIPRSSITSDRRSSNLSTMTTSDFSFRRSSVSPPKSVTDPSHQTIRTVRSSPRSPRRVARPTSLSPIIGTPNKDTQLSAEEPFPAAQSSRRSSVSRIPFQSDFKSPSRSTSRLASRNNSRAPSAVSSRGPSPGRDFLPVSRPNSRLTSRPTSRSSSRADSRVPSRIPSRSNSRSSLYESSTKKASSLSPPKSRNMSPRSSKSRSVSPRKSPRRSMSPASRVSPNRSRSVSRSGNRNSPISKSLSPVKSASPKKPSVTSRVKVPSFTRIPSRKDLLPSAKKISNTLKKPEITVRRSSSTGRNEGRKNDSIGAKKPSGNLIKRETSNLKRETSNLKRETSNLRRETSNLRRETSNLKRETSNLKPVSSFRRETSSLRKDGLVAKSGASNVKKDGVSSRKTVPGIKRETSNVKGKKVEPSKTALKNPKRETSTLKRTPSNLKKENTGPKKDASNLKRQTSNLKREPSNLTSEISNMRAESSTSNQEAAKLSREPSNLKRENSKASLKKSASNPKMDLLAKTVLAKKLSDKTLGKKLLKKNSFRNEKADESDASTIPVDSLKDDEGGEDEKGDKLIPLTKANVISMTTAAITAQPLQITTTITNQLPLTKSNSTGQLLSSGDSAVTKDMDPASILEKSQKTLETVQKTVADATEEIQKTIQENLVDLKTMENDIGRFSDDAGAPFEKSDSLTTILENPAAKAKNEAPPLPGPTRLPADGGEATSETVSKPHQKSPAPPTQPIEANVSVLPSKKSSDNLLHPNVNHNNNMTNSGSTSSATNGMSEEAEDMAERVSERAISVLPDVECESANLQSYELNNAEDGQKNSNSKNNNNNMEPMLSATVEPGDKAKNHPGGDGDGMKKVEEGHAKSDDSQEYLDEDKPKGCCGRFCSKLCMPCRRCQSSSCCGPKKPGSAKSDERIIVEEVNEKRGCWGRCCRKKDNVAGSEPRMLQRRMDPIQEERESESSPTGKKQSGCMLCLGKVFCCRKTNKVESTTEDSEEVRKCCFCIPCGKKKKQTNAWQDRRESIISDPPVQPGCCSRLCTKIFCCCRKPKPVGGSRRTSMNSKKHSLAPTIPLEENRPKLHNDLVEYNSKMKGAIPVMPLWIAWFCMMCNCLAPGLGTIFSGFFCLCVGIPRFSQYDSAKARIGSFIINCIVGVSQAFCVLFCFVGWGWSIWWGTIMLKTARKLKKIRRVEELEMQEELRQQAAERARIEADLEAQKKEDKK